MSCIACPAGNEPRTILVNGMHIHSFLRGSARMRALRSTDPTYAKNLSRQLSLPA